MVGRLHPAWVAFGVSLVVFVVLAVLLWQPWASKDVGPPLIVHAAAALRVPIDAAAADYEREFGQKVEVTYGPSQGVLTQIDLASRGGAHVADLFVPADEVYITQARDKNLINTVFPLASMTAVVVVRPGYSGEIRTWDDFTAEGVRLVIAEKAAAVGKLTEDHLVKTGRWESLTKRSPHTLGTVERVAETVRLGAADAGIIWDSVAHQYPELTVVRLPELAGVMARAQASVVRNSPRQADAHRFARYLSARDKGLVRFSENGFAVSESNDPFGEARPKLLVFAGSMLRPAVEETIKEFGDREGVEVETVYNGCGILVGQMRSGPSPDVYFSCDPQFMNKVSDLFPVPSVVSNNQLVIAVPKGNPHDLRTLKDLGKAGLKVGVGHEQQCALGAITKETFLQGGVYAAVKDNIKVESPAGDLLINQLQTGALDAVVAYRSNVEPFQDKIEGIPVTGIPCARPQQPVAVNRNTRYPQLAGRLLDDIRSAQSKERFVALGFGWEAVPKP